MKKRILICLCLFFITNFCFAYKSPFDVATPIFLKKFDDQRELDDTISEFKKIYREEYKGFDVYEVKKLTSYEIQLFMEGFDEYYHYYHRYPTRGEVYKICIHYFNSSVQMMTSLDIIIQIENVYANRDIDFRWWSVGQIYGR